MSKPLAVGVDLCAVPRIARACENERFMQRVFTPTERAYLCARGKGLAQSAAAMFAAKEAVAKALGTGFSHGVAPLQIEVTHDAGGAPSVTLHGGALQCLCEMRGERVLISLTHEQDMAAAFAVIVSA